MEKKFLDLYVDKRFFIQNPPQSEKEFADWRKKIGIAKQEPIKPLLLSRNPGVVEEMLNKSFGNIMEMRSPLKNKVNTQELRSPLFASTEITDGGQEAKQYYSSFQFVLLDDQLARFSFSREELTKLLLFTIAIQNIYRPFFRADGKHIGFEGNDFDWHTRRKEYNLEEALDLSETDIDHVAAWYKNLSDVARFYLGVGRTDHDWLQLWKNLSWKKKESLEGTVRRGVEYLQWALMIKVAIQDHVGHEILDIDEMSNIVPEDALKIETGRTDRRGMLLRDSRNYLFTDPETKINHYDDKYRRLNYLANSFAIDYHPKLILFVEGYIEELVVSRIFKWYRGSPDYFGIEIVSLDGVDNLKTTHNDAVKLKELIKELSGSHHLQIADKTQVKELKDIIQRLKRVDIILSNWEAFINFNLEKWQSIPFFLADNEGRIQTLLGSSKILRYRGNKYDVPTNWQYLWGKTNSHKPLRGHSFELANFTNAEIVEVLHELYGDSIKEEDVQALRDGDHGLKKLINVLDSTSPLTSEGQPSKRVKLNVTDRLVENMLNTYEKVGADKPSQPIFNAIDRVLQIAALNHAPITAMNEADNHKAIIEQITGA